MKFSNEVKIGVLTLFAIIVFYWGFNYLKGKDIFSINNTFYTIVDDIESLKESSNVTINGVVAGKVETTSILENQTILITLKINTKYKLKQDARAILEQDILGTTKISLEMGNKGNYIQPGDTLQSFIMPTFVDKLKSMTTEDGELSKKELIKTKKRIDELLLTSTVLFKNLNATLLENQKKLKQAISNANKLVNESRLEIKGINPLIQNVNSLVDSLKNIQINKPLLKLNTTLDNVNTLLSEISSEKGTIGKLLKEDSLYMHLDNLIKNVDSTIIKLEENPNHFFAPLGKKKKKKKKK